MSLTQTKQKHLGNDINIQITFFFKLKRNNTFPSTKYKQIGTTQSRENKYFEFILKTGEKSKYKSALQLF